MRTAGVRRRRLTMVHWFLMATAAFTALGLFIVALRSLEPSAGVKTSLQIQQQQLQQQDELDEEKAAAQRDVAILEQGEAKSKGCTTVEEMGEIFSRGFLEESLRARRIIQDHFILNGASRVRALPPEIFCKHGFVIGKASEAGFGNEMYKILTAAALSVMLNRSLIIGQTRHIGVNIRLGITFPTPMFPSP